MLSAVFKVFKIGAIVRIFAMVRSVSRLGCMQERDTCEGAVKCAWANEECSMQLRAGFDWLGYKDYTCRDVGHC